MYRHNNHYAIGSKKWEGKLLFTLHTKRNKNIILLCELI